MRTRALFAALLCAPAVYAADSEVQRQLLQRDRQQLELGLRMQQQQSRAIAPPSNHSADFQSRLQDRDRQQRLREELEHEARERAARDVAIPPGDATRALRRREDAQR
ncbi:MAG TPA: hypothetical protein VHP37_20480 [Burkholderiales bacterium]|nr:hypothetical protein [Burkholderiales bacterium]